MKSTSLLVFFIFGMSYFDGKFMEATSFWDPPPSPSIATILAMLNQTGSGLNPITEIFSQTNLSRDHIDHQFEQRSGLDDRLAARGGFNPPRLETENISSPFAKIFRSSTVPSPIVIVSPRFSPSTLLISSNIVSNSSQIMHLETSGPNYRLQETVENSGEGHVMMTSNTELTRQPLQVNLPPHQEEMSYLDGSFMETTLYWVPPPSPSITTILAMLNQNDNGLNQITEIFSQTKLSGYHTDHQFEQRYGLGERLATRIGFYPPKLETENITSPFAEIFRNSAVPSPIVTFSPGFSPSTFLLSPNMLSNPSHIMHLATPIPNYKLQETVENSGEDNATMMISNNELPHKSVSPHQEGMNYFDGNFTETTSYWAPPPSPSIATILAMLNQTDNGLNPITEIFSQTNLSRDHNNHQSGQISGLGGRLATRAGFNPPRLETGNITSPFVELFSNSTVPSPIVAFSPGFSPSTLLLSPNMLSNLSLGSFLQIDDHATMMISNNEFPHQPLEVNLSPPEKGSADITKDNIHFHETHVEPLGSPLVDSSKSHVVDEAVNIISINKDQSEDKDGDKENDDDGGDEEDMAILDQPEVKPSSPKRRRFEVSSNMIGATRTNKVPRVIIQMENEVNNPDDGYRWRKYGRKVVKGNPNPRGYYKCTFEGCNVKKHIERGAEDYRIVVITYDGIHEHDPPAARGNINSGSKNRSNSSMSPLDHHTYQTTTLGGPSSSSSSHTTSMEMRPLYALGPLSNMTRRYLTGLYKLPNLPVRQNSSFTNWNSEPNTGLMTNGTGVYNGIMHRIYSEFGGRS